MISISSVKSTLVAFGAVALLVVSGCGGDTESSQQQSFEDFAESAQDYADEAPASGYAGVNRSPESGDEINPYATMDERTKCGDDVVAGPNTDCSLARATESFWFASNQEPPGSVLVPSTVYGGDWPMECSMDTNEFTCTGGHNWTVYLPDR